MVYFGKKQAFKDIVAPHKIVHDCVLDSMKYIKDGDKVLNNQDNIYNNFVKMEDASNTLFELLDKMQEN